MVNLVSLVKIVNSVKLGECDQQKKITILGHWWLISYTSVFLISIFILP